ncbi:hypothetical protein PDJAM_G00258380 [Pangasius djambal]|uniref:Uncharacterized protein n=1 Tax=Pangasius djambal TaxID=1691987 RepID=A0ACC5YKT5_9TELE|nr:hypothetical protein [Pangasius djambal]
MLLCISNQELKHKVITLIKNELKRFRELLSPDYPACTEREVEDEEDLHSVREGALKITLHVLKNMNHTDLANTLHNIPVKGTLNASGYQNILDNSMLPTLWEQFGAGPFLFQHDCAPVHKARSIKTWMTESGVDELDWPAQSPDLNPIEHLWDELERRLRARPSRPTSVCDLTKALLEEWSKIPINTLLNLVDSLPSRVEAVIAAKENIPTGERVVIGADFNGHVGEGNTGDEEVMGMFGVKERNLEGQMVVDFAKRMDMAVVNTYFQKREEHRVTYKSGGRSTQVDYILCRRGSLKDISDCKVVVGESVARRHRMVVCRMTLMVCKRKRSKIEKEKKTKWWKLKKEECCEDFRQKLRQALGGQVVLPDDWETTAEVIRVTGRKVLGVSSGRRKEDKETWWWNEGVQDSIQRKRLAKKKWDMDRTKENRQEYKELQRRVKREFGTGPFLFQHDCAPVHKARSIKTWMTESGVGELDWPAQSPDLNPIEHLWDELERRLRARPSRPTSVCYLTNALLEEWSKIPINTLLNLVDSLPRRVEAVIAAKGGPTSY